MSIVHAATLRQKLQIMLAVITSNKMLKAGQLVQALT